VTFIDRPRHNYIGFSWQIQTCRRSSAWESTRPILLGWSWRPSCRELKSHRRHIDFFLEK